MIDGPRRAAQLGRIRGGHDACAAENIKGTQARRQRRWQHMNQI